MKNEKSTLSSVLIICMAKNQMCVYKSIAHKTRNKSTLVEYINSRKMDTAASKIRMHGLQFEHNMLFTSCFWHCTGPVCVVLKRTALLIEMDLSVQMIIAYENSPNRRAKVIQSSRIVCQIIFYVFCKNTHITYAQERNA